MKLDHFKIYFNILQETKDICLNILPSCFFCYILDLIFTTTAFPGSMLKFLHEINLDMMSCHIKIIKWYHHFTSEQIHSHLNHLTLNPISLWLIVCIIFTAPWSCLVQMTCKDSQTRLKLCLSNLQLIQIKLPVICQRNGLIWGLFCLHFSLILVKTMVWFKLTQSKLPVISQRNQLIFIFLSDPQEGYENTIPWILLVSIDNECSVWHVMQHQQHYLLIRVFQNKSNQEWWKMTLQCRNL